MNSKVDPDWIRSAYPYLRAVLIEASEAIEHHGWKWWKKQHRDLPQLQMEVIDIWHFILSEMLLRQRGNEETVLQELMAAAALRPEDAVLQFDGRSYVVGELNLLSKLELLTGISAAGRLDIPLFAAIMSDCDLQWQTLFEQYVGKNVLNFFRQDHGYKQGTYRKLWLGREDNEHLVEIMQQLNPLDAAYPDKLYASLEERYQQSAAPA